jgi:hypothetical protein
MTADVDRTGHQAAADVMAKLLGHPHGPSAGTPDCQLAPS